MYLGKPQQNNTLKIASQSPTKGDPNKLYYEFTNVPEAVKKSMFELAPNNVGDKATLAFDFTQPFETYEETPTMGTMGTYTLSRGVDAKGNYVSYYDK